MSNEKIFKIKFSTVYPLYIKKVEKKGRLKKDVDTVIFWLTGYDEKGLKEQIEKDVDLQGFFASAPQINPNADKIKGVICGIRVEEIEDKTVQNIRRMDKLVDELAKGKAMDFI